MSGVPLDSEPGAVNWRDADGHKHSPIYSGYAFEDDTWRAERDAAFGVSGLAESERLLFEGGWWAASELRGPWPPYATAEMHAPWLIGWSAWPGRRWEDPYAAFTEDYQARLTLEQQDDVTREIKTKEAKRRKRATL